MSSAADLERLANREYQYGFTTDIEQERIPKGLSEATVRLISAKKSEPESGCSAAGGSPLSGLLGVGALGLIRFRRRR